ncbi:MAG: hypothetical protein EKK42_28270 [Pseudonocardiaceae bacterium]|nr:MAG: hypothetical protein EKK42_28270 [Pseudonocardiaceae bacterium]
MTNDPPPNAPGGRTGRAFELFENAPRDIPAGSSPTIWSFPGMVGWLQVAGKPVAGPWPPHQQPRPDPDDEPLPVAIVEPPRPGDHGPGEPRHAREDS